jgi:hypothetical protein
MTQPITNARFNLALNSYNGKQEEKVGSLSPKAKRLPTWVKPAAYTAALTVTALAAIYFAGTAISSSPNPGPTPGGPPGSPPGKPPGTGNQETGGKGSTTGLSKPTGTDSQETGGSTGTSKPTAATGRAGSLGMEEYQNLPTSPQPTIEEINKQVQEQLEKQSQTSSSQSSATDGQASSATGSSAAPPPAPSKQISGYLKNHNDQVYDYTSGVCGYIKEDGSQVYWKKTPNSITFDEIDPKGKRKSDQRDYSSLGLKTIAEEACRRGEISWEECNDFVQIVVQHKSASEPILTPSPSLSHESLSQEQFESFQEQCESFVKGHKAEVNFIYENKIRAELAKWKNIGRGAFKFVFTHPELPNTVIKVPGFASRSEEMLKKEYENIQRAKNIVSAKGYHSIVIPDCHLVEIEKGPVLCETKFDFHTGSPLSAESQAPATKELTDFLSDIGLFDISMDVHEGHNNVRFLEGSEENPKIGIYDLDS